MEGESALHSREVSFHGGGKTLSMAKQQTPPQMTVLLEEDTFSSDQTIREKSMRSSMGTNEEISQSWLQDPDWHRYSAKLEKMAKYQSRLERKLGFDPSSYFGGDVD